MSERKLYLDWKPVLSLMNKKKKKKKSVVRQWTHIKNRTWPCLSWLKEKRNADKLLRVLKKKRWTFGYKVLKISGLIMASFFASNGIYYTAIYSKIVSQTQTC